MGKRTQWSDTAGVNLGAPSGLFMSAGVEPEQSLTMDGRSHDPVAPLRRIGGFRGARRSAYQVVSDRAPGSTETTTTAEPEVSAFFREQFPPRSERSS
jgi:hypothetical protein